jgi:phosphatidylglycerophosphate synthase
MAGQLAADEGTGRILLCGASDEFRQTWSEILDRLPASAVSWEQLRNELDPRSPLVVFTRDGMPLGDGARRFREEAELRGIPAAWSWKGQTVCLYEPEAGRFLERIGGIDEPSDALLEDAANIRVEAAAASWLSLAEPPEVAFAEERFYAGLGHDRDGFLSRFDRRISIALSRRLARTRVMPNQITAVSIIVGLAGAGLIASDTYAACLLGVFLVWLSAILDGCDGEVARIKLRSSRAGQQFDLFGDHVVNFSVFAGLLWHVRRALPDSLMLSLAFVLVTGVGMSALSVWRLFHGSRGEQPQGIERRFQRLASRDFVYALIPLAALGHLDWFVYAAAIGSHLFWIGLIAASLRIRGSSQPRLPHLPASGFPSP